MELINTIRRGILQCEERYKFRLEQEKKTPVQRYSHIYKFGLFISSLLRGIKSELFLFIPTTENTPCFITERRGKTLNLKEIFEVDVYKSIREDLKGFESHYFEEANTFNHNLSLFEYNIYNRKKCEITRTIWRILNITTSTKYQRVKVIIKKFTIPDFYSSNMLLPEGYLFAFLSEGTVDEYSIKESGLNKSDTVLYNDYIKVYKESTTFQDRRLDIEKMPGTLENRVFIGGNYDFMAILNQIKTIVAENGFIPILAFDFNVQRNSIHNYDIRLLANCKYCIFEITKPEGDLMEIERAKDFQNHILLLYQVRESLNREMPSHITTMLSTLQYEFLERQGYNQTTELYGLIRNWLENLKKLPFRY